MKVSAVKESKFAGYKIIASDLDGTLLNNNSGLSPENVAAISALSEMGVYFVPSTGRTFSEIPVELKNNPDIRYYIHSNGAVVFDKLTKDRITNCVSNTDGQFVLDILDKFDCHKMLRYNGECFVDSEYQTNDLWDYYNLCEAHRVVIHNYALYPSEFEKFSRAADGVEVYSVFFKSLADKNKCKKMLLKNERLRVVGADEYNLEICSAFAGKGNALISLAEKLGAGIESTIAMGDSDNDCSIVEAAGLGLAVSNANDALKLVADEVICSNEEHALKFVMENYFS